ncbi:hypothetical protein AVEN_69522-1 [Araneus ventricosus]|uniref:Uncharacterized protein n=1 Tax=Araneus ventricosus TaxID=182803 RepID=A0A4Y2TTX1_ARAVE|nr:hypothetical protein AVEN_69522-1 [Araneus ventricosus]
MADQGRQTADFFPQVGLQSHLYSQRIMQLVTGHGRFPAYFCRMGLLQADLCACGVRGNVLVTGIYYLLFEYLPADTGPFFPFAFQPLVPSFFVRRQIQHPDSRYPRFKGGRVSSEFIKKRCQRWLVSSRTKKTLKP